MNDDKNKNHYIISESKQHESNVHKMNDPAEGFNRNRD